MTPLPSLPQGMAYGNWDFPEQKLKDLAFEIEIVSGDEQKPGRYFQLYDGNVGGIGKYFGFQTDLWHPSGRWLGKGLLYSRWGSNDLADVRLASGGYIERSPTKEGGFIGVRIPFDWTLGRYTCWYRPTDDDSMGRWYEFRVKRHADGVEVTPGSLRFSFTQASPPLIDSGCGTWTEVYGDLSHSPNDEDVPSTTLIVNSVVANSGQISPHRCRTNYNRHFAAAESSVSNRALTLKSGTGVKRANSPRAYDIS